MEKLELCLGGVQMMRPKGLQLHYRCEDHDRAYLFAKGLLLFDACFHTGICLNILLWKGAIAKLVILAALRFAALIKWNGP